MPRTADESRREDARRLYAAGVPVAEIAARFGIGQRHLRRWCAGIERPRGPRPNPAVTDERVIYLRDVEGLSYAQIAAQTGLASWTSARERYRAASGLPRPDRPAPQNRQR